MSGDSRHDINTQPLNCDKKLPELAHRIARLLETTDYAVLCTSDKDQSHGALVAFAASDDFKTLHFATSITTLKYTHLKERASVSLVLDNRALMGRDLGQIEAVTAKGQAHIIEPDKISQLSLLKQKHPNLSQLIEVYQEQDLQPLSSTELADAIEDRANKLKKWQEIYINKFIPFAHGVRQFGYYYNDRMKPQHPYEFIRLLEQCPRQARQRRQALNSLASEIKNSGNMNDLRQVFFETVLERERSQAKHLLHIASLSWQLRDDDNLLMGALESQCLKSLEYAAVRLLQSGLLAEKACLTTKDSKAVCRSLRESVPCELEKHRVDEHSKTQSRKQGQPRQLRGQAASSGLVTGRACIIKSCDDFLRFEAGNIIVCDTVDPVMTHIFPLASGIIERRGGMLIHSTIIARELGLPCVNGVADVEHWIEDGDLITVDGNLGIVIFEQTGNNR